MTNTQGYSKRLYKNPKTRFFLIFYFFRDASCSITLCFAWPSSAWVFLLISLTDSPYSTLNKWAQQFSEILSCYLLTYYDLQKTFKSSKNI